MPPQSPVDALEARLSSTMMKSPCEETFDYLAQVPLCVIALDEEGRAVQINETCREHFGPLFKYSAAIFSTMATDSPEHRAKLEDAIKQARLTTDEGPNSHQKPLTSFKARNIEMLTLSEGLPIKKHFDWTIGLGRDGQVMQSMNKTKNSGLRMPS
jgi:hypothetical protein